MGTCTGFSAGSTVHDDSTPQHVARFGTGPRSEGAFRPLGGSCCMDAPEVLPRCPMAYRKWIERAVFVCSPSMQSLFRSWSPTHAVTLGAEDRLGKDLPAAASRSLPPPPSFIKSPPSPPTTTEAQHTNMFHQGNLQSGISAAIQEQKLVGIFVQGTCVHPALIIVTNTLR
jgi:hypothetical protein